MLAIKFKRIGKKGQGSFRVAVMEKRSKLQGRVVEDLGWYNPRTDSSSLNGDRTTYWLGVGARPTDSVWNLFVKSGIVRGAKIPVHGKPKQGPDTASGSSEVKPIGDSVSQESTPTNEASEAPSQKQEVVPPEPEPPTDPPADSSASVAEEPQEATS